MQQTVEAIYVDGVLRPLEELALRPNQKVLLHIDATPDVAEDLEDKAFIRYCRAEGDANITLEQVRQALDAIPGSLTEACSAERDED